MGMELNIPDCCAQRRWLLWNSFLLCVRAASWIQTDSTIHELSIELPHEHHPAQTYEADISFPRFVLQEYSRGTVGILFFFSSSGNCKVLHARPRGKYQYAYAVTENVRVNYMFTYFIKPLPEA